MLSSPCLLILVLGVGFTDDPCPNKDGDFVIQAVQKSLNEIAREFEIRDQMESQLVFRELTGRNGQLLQTAVSITILRPGKTAVFTYNKRFDERWTLQFTRVINSDVESPIAIVTQSSIVKGEPVVSQTVLRYGTNEQWHVILPKKP